MLMPSGLLSGTNEISISEWQIYPLTNLQWLDNWIMMPMKFAMIIIMIIISLVPPMMTFAIIKSIIQYRMFITIIISIDGDGGWYLLTLSNGSFWPSIHIIIIPFYLWKQNIISMAPSNVSWQIKHRLCNPFVYLSLVLILF